MGKKVFGNYWLKTNIPDNPQETKIPINLGYYLAGFVDGEGSFSASFRKRKDYRGLWQLGLTFNVSQKDETNLILLKKFLGCGRLQRRRDGVCYFVVGNHKDIYEKVIPFFERFKLISRKGRKNFLIFKNIAKLMYNGEHLYYDGLKTILKLRDLLNEGRGRRRKYETKDIIG